mmetsp:Transcript_53844/g.114389  ORF Transcript_53844/g.114389 Transcript_53844/m.114389 type:complete len:550 (+) Transcript_53844:180-1829(+)|eukprot:CAMPEP_0172536748 /NCGR_PEP_ID=MMETSP1067-20121228/8479_1 /TAXON_ID=265564 ORGANISM="Thalassiosira punctigera, Strain Tpunct2005C2" /NCGR_SAMPLE_ID=MMETSP1067 /ASSEMBLY_ACC=CAM_ASM_000444 /LENGTH=549 /DNA_ID=CAMNT_0013321903 /DNA_START=249 /DNA_END=1898 /DNA_ORIENTATION=+
MMRRLVFWIVGILLFALPSSVAQLRGATPQIALHIDTDSTSSISSSGSGSSSDSKKKIVIVSDLAIDLSGVNTCLSNAKRILEQDGHQVLFLSPISLDLITVPLYGVDSGFLMSLPWLHTLRIARMIREFQPDHIHIATEGTLGSLVQTICVRKGWKFSTSYHTNVAEYLKAQAYIPSWITWMTLRNFHSRSSSVMPPTESVVKILKEQRFDPKTLHIWSRGVNRDVFYPRKPDPTKFPKTNGPIFMYVGRVSVEKGINEFLKLPISNCTKYVVGKGPDLPSLQREYPNVVYLGYLTGEDLAIAYSNADVVVFPSRTDTFGNTITEALATGTPVAAFPAPGPIDIIKPNLKIGALNENLGIAIQEALSNGDPDECVRHVAKYYTWELATQQFLENLVPAQCYNEEEPSKISHYALYKRALLFMLVLFMLNRFSFFSMMRHNFLLLSISCKMRRQYNLDALVVVDLIDQGLSNEEMAQKLGCSTKKVDKFIEMCHKTNAKNKTELASWWKHQSLVDDGANNTEMDYRKESRNPEDRQTSHLIRNRGRESR